MRIRARHILPLLACQAAAHQTPAPAGISVNVVADVGAAATVDSVHSPQLMGISAYGYPNFEQPAAQQLVRELGITSIGTMTVTAHWVPVGSDMSVAELAAWFSSAPNGSSPALAFLQKTMPWKVNLVKSHGIRAAGAEPWTYLLANDGNNCSTTGAGTSHCFPDGGTPRPDPNGGWEWWETLFVGTFKVLRELDPSLTYVHIQNEPNAHYWHDHRNGSNYASFYAAVSKKLTEAFPDIVLGGAVTYNPPFKSNSVSGRIDDTDWQNWFNPFLEATAGEPQLVKFVDFHAYNFKPVPEDCGSCDASARGIDMNLQEISIATKALGRGATHCLATPQYPERAMLSLHVCCSPFAQWLTNSLACRRHPGGYLRDQFPVGKCF